MAWFLLPTPPSPYMRPLVRISPKSPEMFLLTFSGDNFLVTVTKRASQVDAWISIIKILHDAAYSRVFVGLDTEWLPNLSPGDNHLVAVLQLCVGRHCLIFQLLHADGSPNSLRAFLNDDRYIFSGVGVPDDASKLFRDHRLRVKNAVDVNDLTRFVSGGHCGYMGMKKMCMMALGKEMMKPKEVTLSKWDAYDLDTNQIEYYAAIDAIVSFQIAFMLSSWITGEVFEYLGSLSS